MTRPARVIVAVVLAGVAGAHFAAGGASIAAGVVEAVLVAVLLVDELIRWEEEG